MFEKASNYFKSDNKYNGTPNWEVLSKPNAYEVVELSNGWCFTNGVESIHVSNEMCAYEDMYQRGMYDELRLVPTLIIKQGNSDAYSWLVPVFPSGMTKAIWMPKIVRLRNVLSTYNVTSKLSNLYEVFSQIKQG